MASFVFILGLSPVSTGERYGAEMDQALGTAVFTPTARARSRSLHRDVKFPTAYLDLARLYRSTRIEPCAGRLTVS
jgi:hypothetical protein